MKHLRRTAGYTLLDHKRKEDILEELTLHLQKKDFVAYIHNWFQHVHRTEDCDLDDL
jgi:hypothetical protein